MKLRFIGIVKLNDVVAGHNPTADCLNRVFDYNKSWMSSPSLVIPLLKLNEH